MKLYLAVSFDDGGGLVITPTKNNYMKRQLFLYISLLSIALYCTGAEQLSHGNESGWPPSGNEPVQPLNENETVQLQSGSDPALQLQSENVPLQLQSAANMEVYLVTCGAGGETYSMYGHSALRITNIENGSDIVYNWGVFDFSTPNFAYKFARGRLDYLLAAYPFSSFLQEYLREERSVVTQKINLTDRDKMELHLLLIENLKPENWSYRYDFFMDNCATRIRDILEAALGDNLIYPDGEAYPGTMVSESAIPAENSIPSFRDRINEYQQGSLVWMDMGIDLLLGSPADRACGYRESMFLPDYLMSNLSAAKVISGGVGAVPLLEEPVVMLAFDPPSMKNKFFTMPWFLISLAAVVLIILTYRVRNRWLQNGFDTLFFTVLVILSFLMIFTNYLTDHEAMGNNYNIIWLNPLLLAAPVMIFLRPPNRWYWMSQIALTLTFMVVIVIVKQTINPAFIPLMVLLIARSHYRLTSF